MITLTYKHIVTSPLVPTLLKLVQMSVFDGKTAYRLHKINEGVRENYQKSLGEFDALGLKFGEVGEDGQIKKDEKGQHAVPDEKKAQYTAELEKFLTTEFTIAQHKIHVNALSSRFSPMEISALEPLIDGLEDEMVA